MSDLLSLDDIYGGTPPAPPAVSIGAAPPPPPRNDGVLSLEDIYGPEKPFEAGAGRGRQGGPTAKELEKPGTGKQLAYEAATFGDMLLGIPAGIAGTVAEGAFRASAPITMQGTSHAGRSEAGRGFREYVTEKGSPQVFTSLVKALAGDEEPTESHISKAMTKLQGWIDKGGKFVDEKTGGVLNKDDVNGLVNAGMNAIGTKALRAVPEGRFNPALARRVGETTPKPEGVAPTPEAFEAKEVKESDNAKTQKDMTRERRAAAREAFSGDPKAWKEYLEKHAGVLAEEKYTAAQAGKASPEMLAVLAGASGAVALARAYPDKQDDMLAGAQFIGMFGTIGPLHMREGSALGSLLEGGEHSLKTLDRLPQNHVEFSKKTIEEQLRRDDVSKAEKEVLTDVLKRWGDKEKISAADLVKGVRSATQDFVLTEKETPHYAPYGLEGIDRLHYPEGTTEDNMDFREMEGPPGRTSIWKLPEHLDVGTANHFQEPRYFGHTRSFDENGVRHVVEIQSDLAQKAKQRLTEEEYKGLSAEHKQLENNIAELWRKIDEAPTNEVAAQAHKALADYEIRRNELSIKLAAHEATPKDLSSISPMLKNWDRRLAREELAAAARRGEPMVRFATADTVAKVEGWPEGTDHRAARTQYEADTQSAINQGDKYPDVRAHWEKIAKESKEKLDATPRFEPEHQGIYDRYAKETTKFLKNLGAKEITDSAGHTWLETPTGVKAASKPLDIAMAKRAQMFGGASPEQLKNLAYLSIGAVVGAKLDQDNPVVGAFVGAFLGAGAIKGGVAGASKVFSAFRTSDTRIRINDRTQEHAHRIAAAERATYQIGEQIIGLVPDKARREAIHRALDQGKINDLVGKEKEAALLAQDFYAKIAVEAEKMGVLDDARADYSTHLWRKGDKAKLDALFAQKRAASMSPNSRFNKERIFVTMEEGKKAGLKPLTEDLSDVLAIYGNSMARTMANRNLLDRLKNARGPEGERLIAPSNKAPGDYVVIDNPALRAVRVHPDIAPSLKFMYEAQSPGEIMNALSVVNTALKRNAVSFSLFHAKALADAMLGAVNNPGLVVKAVGQAAAPRLFGTNRYLKLLKEGGAGDLVDDALKDGAKISYQRGESSVQDVGGGFYDGMKSLQVAMDEKLPFNLGKKTIGTYIRVNHAFDNFMWGRLHAAMKLEVYAAKREALMENSAKAGKPLTKQQAGEIAAEYANDVFGGLNWQRIAEGAKTKYGRDLSLSLMSPGGRRMTQLLMFAPDWTLSTSRAFFKAFQPGQGSGIGGLVSAKTSADLYRQQLVRSALYYVAIGDAINYYNSGHHLWQNDDKIGPFYVDLGDGRKMQLSKHFTEPFHWMTEPGQQGLNKLGFLPKEVTTQALGKEYLSTKGMPPMDTSLGGRAGHIARNAVPIGASQAIQNPQNAAAGAMGVPIYGKTLEQKRAEAKRKRNEAFQKTLQQYKKAHGLE